MSAAALRHRHRPRHHPLRAGLCGHQRQRRRSHRQSVLAIPQLTAPGTVENAAAAAVVPVPAARRASWRRASWPCPGSGAPRVRGRRDRARSRGAHDADPPGLQRQELALPRRRGSARRHPAGRRARRGGASLAARRPRVRYLEHLRAGLGPRPIRRRRSPSRTGHRHRPGLVRPGRARAHGRGRPRRRLRHADAARRAAGGALQLDPGQRRRAGASRCSRATSSWSSTSAAAPATSR